MLIDVGDDACTGLRLPEPVLVFLPDSCENLSGLSSAVSTILRELLALVLPSCCTGGVEIVDLGLQSLKGKTVTDNYVIFNSFTLDLRFDSVF